MNGPRMNKYAEFWIENHVLFIVFKSDLRISIQEAMEIVADRLLFQQGRSYVVCCDVRGLETMDFEARNFLAGDGMIGIHSLALLVKENRSETMAQFFVSRYHFPCPVSIFRDQAKARNFVFSQ